MADPTYTVTRSVTIDAPAERVFPLVADFRRWPAWSPWEDVDPALRRSYSGAASGAGSVYTWSGNRRAGQGRMEIIEAAAPSFVRIDLAFEKPFKARNDTSFTIAPLVGEGAGSVVTWSMTGRNTLVTRVMGLFTSMETFLGRDFEKGLARLKRAAEGSGPT